VLYLALWYVLCWLYLLPLPPVVLEVVASLSGVSISIFTLYLLVCVVRFVRRRFVLLGALNVFWACLKEFVHFHNDLPSLFLQFDVFPAGGIGSPG
jgi:hypothetical protein